MLAMLPDEVHQRITDRIAALVPTDGYSSDTAAGYAQSPNDAWRQASEPLVPESSPSTTAHLVFFVDDRSTENSDGSTALDEILTSSVVTIRFLFQLRPMDQVRDWRASGRAAAHLLAWLLVDGWSEQFNVLVPEGQFLLRTPVGGGEWLACELRIRIHYALSLYVPA
jgi:hypothetical protein